MLWNSSPAIVWCLEVKDMDTEVMEGSGKVRENIWREHLEIQLLCSCRPCTELIPWFSNLLEKECEFKAGSKAVQKQPLLSVRVRSHLLCALHR